MSQVDAIRNKEGIWINTNCFREEGLSFQKNKYFTPEAWGSPAWVDYWNEQLRRCRDGYTVGGAYITGHHYFYLNFTNIMLTKDKGDESVVKDIKKTKGSKVSVCPDFWDGDYNYFHALDIARNGCSREYFDNLKLGLSLQDRFLTGGYHMIVGKARRKGYQQPHSEIVMTPDGINTMGNINIGDDVLTPTGKAKVLEKYPQGKCDVYEIELYDGRKVKCGLEHLWKIYSSSFRKDYRQSKVVDTKFLLNSELKTKKGYKWFLGINEEVQYETKTFTIPPYTLGCILGDGNVSRQFKISGIDEEVFDNCLEELKDFYPDGTYIIGNTYKANKQFLFNCTREIRDSYKTKYNTSKFANKVNPIYEELKLLKLNCTSNNKYIPEIYKYGSIEQRYELVKGMMDTDGSITKEGYISFSNVSKQLVKDLQEVLYSLGITSTFRKRKDGLYIIYINSSKEIFKLSRKINRIIKEQEHRNFIPIIKVTKLDYQEESSCILIDSEEHLYLTKDYIITHNSYKNAAICANTYNSIPDSLVIIGAFDKKFLYPRGTMGMASRFIDFLNANTGWRKAREFVDKQEHRKASYKSFVQGVPVERGYMSEIMALTFGDNPDAARGKDGIIILYEEAGKFPNLKDAYMATKESLEDGTFITGQMVIFGTGGDMESGTIDFAEMFFNPEAFDLLPFNNIWDPNANQSLCGFFHPENLNLVGFYDKEGNSDFEGAKKYEIDKRDALRRAANSSYVLQKRVQEKPLCPSEAFLTVSTNDFPIVELQHQLDFVRRENLHIKKSMAGTLYRDEDSGKVRFKIDLKNELTPITSYKIKDTDIRGAVVIYEYPIPDAPKGLYKIGYDPYRQNQAADSTSLGATFVYKGVMQGQSTYDCLVASYVGRPNTSDDYNRNLEMLSELYVAEIGFENEVTEVRSYFTKRKKLHLLAVQPDAIISATIKHSKVARVYGIHMNEKLKDAGEKYLKQWLLTEKNIDEEDKLILNLNTIYDMGLLEELIQYNRKGNFDRISALIVLMMFIENDGENKIHGEKLEENEKFWDDFAFTLFKN
jgi:hypothetical protein